MNKRLDDVFEYEMTQYESDALQLAITWEEQTKRMFPKERLSRLPKKGDPRKSELFRWCWKVLRETRGLLEEKEYKLYIIANLTIISHWNGRVCPNALSGDKAWVRWRIWKRLYDKKQCELQGIVAAPQIVISPKIVRELDCTKRFMHEQCDGQPTYEKLEEFYKSGKLKRWILSSKISIFYLVLSPFITKLGKLEELRKKCGFDPKVYSDMVTPDVQLHFKTEFPYESE